MRQVYETIDRQHFQWIVVLVAGVGFFLDGYTVHIQTLGTHTSFYTITKANYVALRKQHGPSHGQLRLLAERHIREEVDVHQHRHARRHPAWSGSIRLSRGSIRAEEDVRCGVDAVDYIDAGRGYVLDGGS